MIEAVRKVTWQLCHVALYDFRIHLKRIAHDIGAAQLRQFRLNLIRQPIHAHQYTGREVANRFRITLFDVQRVESAGIAGDGEAQLF